MYFSAYKSGNQVELPNEFFKENTTLGFRRTYPPNEVVNEGLTTINIPVSVASVFKTNSEQINTTTGWLTTTLSTTTRRTKRPILKSSTATTTTTTTLKPHIIVTNASTEAVTSHPTPIELPTTTPSEEDDRQQDAENTTSGNSSTSTSVSSTTHDDTIKEIITMILIIIVGIGLTAVVTVAVLVRLCCPEGKRLNYSKLRSDSQLSNEGEIDVRQESKIFTLPLTKPRVRLYTVAKSRYPLLQKGKDPEMCSVLIFNDDVRPPSYEDAVKCQNSFWDSQYYEDEPPKYERF